MPRKRSQKNTYGKQVEQSTWARSLARVITAPGLEELLVDELESFDLDCRPVRGAVEVEVTPQTLALIHVHCRLASKVMLEVGASGASSLDALSQGARKVPWHMFFLDANSVRIQIDLKGSRLKQKSAIEKKVRWAIGDTLSTQRRSGPRQRPKRHRAGQKPQELFVRIKGQKAWFSLNASGEFLYRRGWRQHVSQAPIRENLAAAMLAFAEWSPEEPLVDPMCGSGTIPIEAGTIAQGIAPGLHRSFGFEQWPCHDPEHLAAIRQAAAAESALADTLILGGDKNERAIEAAVHNVSQAGLKDRVFFQCSPFKALQSPGQPGLVLTNPPYGHRIGDQQGLGDMYAHVGRVLKQRWVGWRVAILVPDLRLKTRIGLPLESVATFKNGGIPVWLLMGRV